MTTTQEQPETKPRWKRAKHENIPNDDDDDDGDDDDSKEERDNTASDDDNDDTGKGQSQEKIKPKEKKPGPNNDDDDDDASGAGSSGGDNMSMSATEFSQKLWKWAHDNRTKPWCKHVPCHVRSTTIHAEIRKLAKRVPLSVLDLRATTQRIKRTWRDREVGVAMPPFLAPLKPGDELHHRTEKAAIQHAYEENNARAKVYHKQCDALSDAIEAGTKQDVWQLAWASSQMMEEMTWNVGRLLRFLTHMKDRLNHHYANFPVLDLGGTTILTEGTAASK
jgi:hypothetical protein